jgi:hypothetical protein
MDVQSAKRASESPGVSGEFPVGSWPQRLTGGMAAQEVAWSPVSFKRMPERTIFASILFRYVIKPFPTNLREGRPL